MNTVTLFNPILKNSLWDTFERGFETPFRFIDSDHNHRGFLPSVDVTVTKESYTITMDLPGYTEDDVKIEFKDYGLTISSKQKTEESAESTENSKEKGEDKGVRYIIKERSTQEFSRRFTLPKDIENEQIKAEFKHGILSIVIPRKPEEEIRLISIKTV